MTENCRTTREILESQLACLRREFDKLSEEELFRIYLKHLVRERMELFRRIVDPSRAG